MSGDSPFDRYLYRDDKAGMSPAALRGMRLFFSDRLRCAECHGSFNLSGPVDVEGTKDPRADFPQHRPVRRRRRAAAIRPRTAGCST